MRVRGLVLGAVVWVCALAGLLALGGVPAGAAITHHFLSRIVEVPAGPGVSSSGPLVEPRAVTVDGGVLYVADGGSSNGRLDKFNDSSGAFVSQFAQAPSLSYFRQGVAVSHASGEVYVGADLAGTGEGVVAAFSAGGTLQKTWTGDDTPVAAETVGFGCFECNGPGDVAVDNNPSSLGDWAAGDVYVAEPARGVVDVFKPKAGGEEEWVARIGEREAGVPLSNVFGVAVDPANGDVLVVDAAGVDVFEPTVLHQYALVRRIAETTAGHPFRNIDGVAVDGGTGDIYVDDQSPTRVIDQFNAAGIYLGSLTEGPAGPLGGAAGLAVDPGSHDVYVGDGAGEGQGRTEWVDVFGETLTIPDVSSESASSVLPASATLNGVVNPDGVAVSECYFEYGASTAYGQSVPCTQTPVEIGAGSAPVAVSATVTGLVAGTVYHFRLVAGNVNGTSTAQDEVFGPPRIDGESASGETKTTATLGAQIDPNGVATAYRFEYGTTTAYGTSVPVPPAGIGAGTSDQAASAELTGLGSGVSYHYRVVAVNSAGTSTGEDETFTTVPPARIEGVALSSVSATGATVSASIDPIGTDTTYHIEYGTSTAYGASVPVPDADIGAGEGNVPVVQQLAGLTANTTYHLRVVAANALGVVRGDDHTFVYDTSGEGLPDGRAYEMVTPPNKNGALFGNLFVGGAPAIAEDGSRVIVFSIQCFAGAVSCTGARQMEGDPFAFARTDGGWVTTPLAPPATQFDQNTYWSVSPGVGTALFSVPAAPFGEDVWYVRQPDGSFLDIGPVSQPSLGSTQVTAFNRSFPVATADFSHIVYASSKTFWSFDATGLLTGPDGDPTALYEYVGAGDAAPVLVGVSGGAGSTDLISECGTEVGGVSSENGYESSSALSGDGGTVYFTADACSSGSGVNAGVPVPADELFARIGGSRSAWVSGRSPSGCTGMCASSPPAAAAFEGASVDGSKAFFSSTQQLTNGASEDSHSGDTAREGCSKTAGVNGCNLYEYDFANPAGRNLIDVSAGDTSGGGPRVQGVMAFSPDGSRVYFVAKGVLSAAADSEGQVARNGADNLYVFERDASHPEGRVSFIATLSESDRPEWELGSDGNKANVTPDGRFLVFTSHGRLTADDKSTSGAAQVFRYDAQTGELLRISIGERGFNDNGNAGTGNAFVVPRKTGYYLTAGPRRPDPTMSNDGSFVFFQSPVGLTPQALNDVPIDSGGDLAQNVYEWHEGQVYLVSDGRDTSADNADVDTISSETTSSVYLLGSDATGANVFFTTADRLVPQDIDTQLDVYDARIGGGFPFTPPPVPCGGEACHGTPGAAPSLQGAASAVFSGAGNLTAPAQPVVKAKKKKAVRKKARRGKAKRTQRAHGKKGRRGRASRQGKRVERGRK